MRKTPYTKQGYENLLKEKESLDARRIEAVKELAVASAMGDRSENAAYKYGKQKVSGIDRQLRYVNKQLIYAEVVEPRTDGKIDIGSKVKLDNGKGIQEFTIVGGHESDVLNARISHVSPLGRALIGKKVNEQVAFFAPAGKIEYKIIQID